MLILAGPSRPKMSSSETCGQTSEGEMEGDEEIEGSELVEVVDELAR